MTRHNAVLQLCAALVLAGCAGGENSSFDRLFSSSARSDQSVLDFPEGSKGTLYLGIVDGLIKQGRHGAALAFLDGYSQNGEDLSPRYWLLRGNALLGLHRPGEAAVVFAKLQETSLAAQGWNGLGRIAADQGDWPIADQDFRKAVDGDPADADFLNNLAFADLHLDKPDSAIAGLQQARELDPSSDRIFMNLIIALTIKGDGRAADNFISGIKNNTRREAVRSLVKNAVLSLHREGKS
jgi:Flp pilus assembly protein TadD